MLLRQKHCFYFAIFTEVSINAKMFPFEYDCFEECKSVKLIRERPSKIWPAQGTNQNTLLHHGTVQPYAYNKKNVQFGRGSGFHV